MKLSDAIKNIEYISLVNFEDVEIGGISYNSKETKEGDVFVCIKGFNVDGHDYANNATEKGCVAILCEKELDINLPQIVVKNTRQVLADVAANFYKNPSLDLNLIGITGTNGKTTVTHLLQKILENANQKAAIIGTMGHKLSSKDAYKDEDRTTPQALELQKLFREFVDDYNVKNVFMEVSSHALEQNRVGRCGFNGAVFTNLSQDHLDYHNTMEEYFNAKAMLFEGLEAGGFGVVNADDEYGKRFLSKMPQGVKQITYGIKNNADFVASDINFLPTGASFICKAENQEKRINLKMNGMFSVYNALAAIACASAMGIDFDIIASTLESIDGVSGRFEVVVNEPMVIVDYAHTPDGLENVLKAAREITPTDGKLICLFGCGGNRDATKRPIMAKIAQDLADAVVVTNDNPRFEDPKTIIEDILKGFVNINNVVVEEDRGQAIAKIKEFATKKDVVLLAGKGHETYQIIKDEKLHFDDKEEAIKTFLS